MNEEIIEKLKKILIVAGATVNNDKSLKSDLSLNGFGYSFFDENENARDVPLVYYEEF